VILELYW